MYISWKPDPKALAIGAFSIKWNTEFYYIFPPFSLLGKVAAKTYRDKIKAIVVIPKWSAQHWYPKLLRKATKSMTITPSAKNPQTPGSTKSSPTTPKALPTSTPDRLTTQDIISASLRKSTCQKYLCYQTCWKEYCAEKNILYDSPTVEQFLSFFNELFNLGVSYSVLTSAKSAAAHVLKMKCQHLSQHSSVIKYFKGSFNLRLSLTQTSFVWDVQIMFEYFRSLGDSRQISDKRLSQKLLILLLLLGGQRLNSVFHFTIDRMIISSTSVTFSPEHVLKHSKPGRKLDVFEYRAYSDPNLCV